MSKTMSLPKGLDAKSLHRAQWAGRIMSALVIIVLVVDGTIELFAPSQIVSMLQETGFALELTRVVGSMVLFCAILYAIPSTAVLGAILVTRFSGRRHLRPCSHWRAGIASRNHLPASGRIDMGRPVRTRSACPGNFAIHSLTQQGQ